jgi:hypothetical protein
MALCDEMRLLLGPFDDGELEPHEMEEVAFHVVGCVGCKSALDDYRALGVALRDGVIVPSLDNFAADVATRIDHTWVPLRARLGRLRDAFSPLGSVFEIIGVAAATAVVTLMVATPYARQFIAGSNPVPVADHAAQAVAPPISVAQVNLAKVDLAKVSAASENVMSIDAAPDDAAIHESQELISRLSGGESPSVLVWGEPRTGTTVVWIPDQP